MAAPISEERALFEQYKRRVDHLEETLGLVRHNCDVLKQLAVATGTRYDIGLLTRTIKTIDDLGIPKYDPNCPDCKGRSWHPCTHSVCATMQHPCETCNGSGTRNP